MRFIRQIIQQLGLSPREGGGGAKRFCLPLLALICAAALAGLYLAPSRAADYWSDAANKEWYGDGAPTAYTMEKMTLRVGEGWPYLPVVYVKPDGTGDGSSWANAMGGADFSAMLKWINTQNSGKNYNFYVAKGTYAQTETLPLPKGVKLYGGFAGTETETIASRDIKANETILSRDASVDNISIVTGGKGAASADTVLDGFTITGGKGTDPDMLWYSTAGGGLFNDSSSPLIANCTFSGNYCYAGPAIFNCRDSSPYVYRCSFEQNSGEYGGAVCSESFDSTGAVAPSFVECVFKNNIGAKGGAIYSAANSNTAACTPFIDKCRFLSNQTTKLYGGAIADNSTAHSTISNSEFTGNFTKNAADASGGAIFINAARKTSVITNCTFANNKANGGGSGGALYVNGLSSLIIANCTFSGNGAANKGGAVYSASTPVTAVNSIFWGDTAVSGDAEIAYAGGGSSASLYNSVVQGGWTEGGDNISEIDPKFLTASPKDNGGPVPTMAVSAGGSAFRAGTAPDKVISGDFKTPLTDARGVSFDKAHAEIGAYAWRYAGGEVAITTAGYSCEIGDERTVSLDSTVKAVSTDAVDKGAVKLVTLSSSNTSAAVVSGDAVRAVGRGTATIRGSADGSLFTVSGSFTVTAASRSLPKAEVTEDTRTDTTGATENASGIVVIGDSTAEDFAVYDGFDALAASKDLPVGITVSSVDAITKAQSKDIEISSRDIFSDEAIKKAIGAYWQLGETSADKVHMVQVRSATGETQGVFAKIWSLLKSFFINGKDTYDSNKYLPLQANFVISSADVAELPEYVRSGLTKDTLLAKLNLFVLVKSGDAAEPAARSLSDITSNEGWISVADDGSNGYLVKTRLMVFDQTGGVTTGSGAKWVQKFAAKEPDKVTDRAEGNYFLVQDGKADQEYAVAMAFAAKEHNYATLHVTVETASGDIPASVDWSVSGDNGYSLTGITSSDWTAVVSGDANYTFTFPQYAGYTLNADTAGKHIEWGGTVEVKAVYSQIHAESVSLDETAATLGYWSAASHDVLTLTATISPDKTLDKTVSWATSDANIADVDQSGNVTPTGKGKATITATAEGKTASCDVTVVQRIDSAVITVSASEVYTGGEIKPDVTVTLDGTALNAENYEVSYTDNTNVGTATVTVKGTAANYYGGEASAAFAITKRQITVTPSAGQSKTYGATEPVFAYSSSETGATFTGALARETGDNVGTYAYTLGSLSAGTNYTLTLNNNADKFKITAKDASALNAALSVTSYVYDGAAKEPAVTVKDGGKTLVEGVDYTVAYSNNKDAGTAKTAVTCTGNYSGNKELTFTITAKDASSLNAALSVTSYVYDGAAKEPAVTITDGKTTLVKGVDYTVAYSNNKDAGTAKAAVTYTSNYSGSKELAFTITAKDASTLTIAAVSAVVYDGKAKTPELTVMDGETKLVKGADYDVAYDNNIKAGMATATASFKDNYTGTKSVTFEIAAKDASTLTIAAVSPDVYDGKAKTPELTVKDGETKLVKDTDYTVTYDKNTNVGTATAKATFIGNYKGEKSVTFEITPKKTTLTIDPIADQTYTGGAITPAVTVKDGEKTLKDTDYTLSWANNVKIGTATVTATGKGNYEGSTGSAAFRVIPIVAPSDVTESTRTDGDNSGILPIADGTTEDFAIFDAMRELAKDGKLASGISYDAKALAATSADIDSSAFLSSADIKAAIGGYWNISGDSENKVRLVEVQNTVATRAGEGETIFAKFWKMLVSLFKTNNGEDAFSEGDYLPVQANFTIRSADIAELPDEVKEGLTKDNLIDKISLFTIVVDDKGEISARSLVDVAGNGKAAHITVTGDSENGYAVKTRVMLFDMEGGLSGDKTTGAKWVQPLKVSSSDQRTNEKDNYFIVQDGAKDGEYKLCLAFAAKEANYASVSLTTSGDIESKDIDYVRWAISGDAAQHEADSSADIRGDEQSVTLIVPGGYHVTLSDETQTLSRDVKTISADVTWGGEWKITALFEKIKAESVTLDKTTLALAVGGNAMLTAAVTPDSAYAKDITWTTSDGNVAEVAADGTITAKAAGKATITAAANDGSGAKAECAVTVRKSAADDPAVTPAEPEAVKPEVVTPNENVVPVTPGYVTDPVKQEDVMNEIGLKAEDAAVTENGSLTVAGGLADKAAGEVIANDPDTVSKDSVISLPVTVSSADEAGMIHALGFKVSGDVFGKVDGVGEIRVLKIFTDGGGKAFTVVTAAEAIADKTVALYDANNEIVTGAIDAAATYTLTAFVLDGGEYDLGGKTDGKVIDPIAIIKQAEPPVSPTPTGGSGGGCNAGAGALALAALIPLAVRRGKR